MAGNQETIRMDQVAEEQQENSQQDSLESPAPSSSALAAYQAGGQYQSASYAAMFNAYLTGEKEKERHAQMVKKLQVLNLEATLESLENLEANHGSDWNGPPKSPVFAGKMTGKDAGENSNSNKVRHQPYSVKKTKDYCVPKLKRQALTPQSADANSQPTMDTGNDSDAQLGLEDLEANGFGSNSLP